MIQIFLRAEAEFIRLGKYVSASAKLSVPDSSRWCNSSRSWRNCSSNSEYKTTAAAPASSMRLMLSTSSESGDAETTNGERSFSPR